VLFFPAVVGLVADDRFPFAEVDDVAGVAEHACGTAVAATVKVGCRVGKR
jgi:hypothetical protein